MICYIKGDATHPSFKNTKIIAHICNTDGKWGRGFVLAISKRWTKPREEYYRWYNNCSGILPLGQIQLVPVETKIFVANMIAQKGIRTSSERFPIRYDALRECLILLRKEALDKTASIHMPRIGTGLAGGRWEIIEPMIKEELSNHGIAVYVYDLR